MKNKKIVTVEYWFDGITSSYQVTKKDYYNMYLNFPKFRRIVFDDGTEIYC
ncbi:MAG: hypothetical protein WC319_14965 [Candidatus Paceibacterota bacterium]|jgi:hypothetical protein